MSDLTCAQRQLWNLHAGGAPPRSLNLNYTVAIDGPLDLAALDAAFGTLVRANEPLRTTYRLRDGSVAADVHDVGTVPPLRTPLLPTQTVAAAEAAALAAADRSCRFDLERDFPIRARVLEVRREQHILVLTMHHIAADGWSLYLLRTQLSQYYAAFARGEVPDPTPPRPECVELARAQQEWLLSPEADAQARWWLDRLSGAALRPTGLRPAIDPTSTAMREHVVAIRAEVSADLRALAKQAGVSMFVVMLTAFTVLVERCLGCPNAVVGTLVANRPTAASSQVMGAHYNTLLLNADIGGDPSLVECLLGVADRVLSALDRQSLPLPALSERLEHKFGWDPTQTPSVMFIMDRYPMEGLTLTGCQVSGLYLDDRTGQFAVVPAAVTADLVFFVREAGDSLTLSALWRPGAIQDADVADLTQSYLEILAAMCESPEITLTDLQLRRADSADMSTSARPIPDSQGQPTLRKIADVAPADALSPVGDRVTGSPGRTRAVG